MKSTAVELPSERQAAQRAEFTSQATAIEQARAVAEVQAAVLVAQQCPRNTAEALRQMREACGQQGLAERAFYRYSRGGGQVTGESIHLARELARCWGNIDYGIRELRRDDAGHYSEMQAFAWDQQTNTRTSMTFVVPHKRDKKGGADVLTDMRDIYENNANMGARRVREAIFAVLPKWFTEEAKSLCMETIANPAGDKRTMEQRTADAVKWVDGKGVKLTQLEAKVGAPQAQWTAGDLATLKVISSALSKGESTIEDEFPTPRVTGAELVGVDKTIGQPGDTLNLDGPT